MIDWLFDASKKALELGVDAWKKDQANKNLRNAIAGRLVRELNFIEQILMEFCINQEFGATRTQVFDEESSSLAAKLYADLKTEAFDTLTNSPSPLEAFLPEGVATCGFSRPDRRLDYGGRIKDRTVSDVIERCYLRVKILRQRAKAELDLGDVDYVIFLVRSAKASLKVNERSP
ncbi:hypothetical protein [Variovorax sp. PvP013]|jgi:hypothetical protein|uniref:hypothetical protein n=1 Tax=Variovorax sp. PvP013 TaxID=3156435 RepID=UPI003D19EB42